MRVEVRSIGPVARRALRQASEVEVIASCDRSFYLEAGSQLVCVAHESLYEGPFNLVTRTADRQPIWPDLEVLVGERLMMRAGSLSKRDGSGLVIDLRTASTWQPKPPSRGLACRELARCGIDHLRELATSRVERDGLLDPVLYRTMAPANAAQRAAMRSLLALPRHAASWLDEGDLRIVTTLEDLLGLGPGLTPSGDDLIAGLLIASHAIGRGQAALDLWRRLLPLAKTRTTSISFAHLDAAGEGLGAAPFHDLLAALIENRIGDIAPALDAVARIGHCSGWDAVGGLLLLFNAWIRARAEQPAAA